jgi:CRP/FNR family transcriptional regulator
MPNAAVPFTGLHSYAAWTVPTAVPTGDAFTLLQENVPVKRRVVQEGDRVHQVGQPLEWLHVVHSGSFKTINLTPDGREQVVGLHLKGDWLGFDGIARNRHSCDAVAMDIGAVWSVSYAALLQASARQPALAALITAAMSREITRERNAMMSLCTLSANARVAEFLRVWLEALGERGLRTDQITLRMSRAEIGKYLGLTLESVSRAFSQLARENVIGFPEKGRRHMSISDAGALARFVQRSLPAEDAAPRGFQRAAHELRLAN